MTPMQELELKMIDPPNGSILEIKVSFDGSPKTYSYVAVEAAGGWYLTNIVLEIRSWEDLIDWFKNKGANVVSLRRTTEWETLL